MYSPLFDPMIIIAFLAITGMMGVMALPVAALASLFSYLIGRIPQRWLQAILPVAIALVFIAGERPFQSFMYTSLSANDALLLGSFVTIIHVIPQACILAMGAITPFPLIREHLTLKREWHAIFAAAMIAVTGIYLQNMFIAFGPRMGTYLDISRIPYIEFFTGLSQFVEAMVIAAAVFGAILFLQHVQSLVASHPCKQSILLAVVTSLFVLLPAAAIGGLAVFFMTILKRIPGRMIPMGISAAALVVLSLIGSILMGIPGLERVLYFSLFTMAIMAFAVLVPFLYFAPGIGKTWQPVILLAGAVAADLILSLIAVSFELGERLTADSVTILTFAEGGMIIAAGAFAVRQFLVTRDNSPSSPAMAGEAP
ncbi:hypothetical protein [Methanoregula sp.]|uniref:hypothetical protein n=1 Tax=Methanoregula sp. TaxID=2052170 RepID=UPI00356B581E